MQTNLKPNPEADINGTHLQGYLRGITYAQLVEAFGEPLDGDMDKVAFEWTLETSDGDVVTVYPWKNTSLYDDGLPSVSSMKIHNKTWHIGGRKRDVVEVVQAAFASLEIK